MTTFRSFKKVQESLLNSTTNCVAITQSYLDEIEKNKHLNAFVEVFAQEALQEANRIDKKIKAGSAGKLAGMVIGLKEISVKVGEKVLSKEKIGVVITQDSELKTELHFEIWKGYEKQDPSKWLFKVY